MFFLEKVELGESEDSEESFFTIFSYTLTRVEKVCSYFFSLSALFWGE
jgi:hypothetical protein